jgi:signal transduction histidine kinase
MDIIGSEIHRLDRVVQILVDFTRPRELRMEEVDMRKLLEDVASLADPDAHQHGVTIATSFPPDPLIVKVDNDFMKQAVLNVVLNGIQAMSDGGKLTIAARLEDGAVVTDIQDEGRGIPHDVQEKIFELYFTTKKGGSGIGLAQTYQILQWHYGTIDFDSADGEGATFHLTLPAVEPSGELRRELTQRPAQVLGSSSGD